MALLALLVAAPASAVDDKVEEWALPEVPEPSGVVYHPGRKSLFVVSDEGYLAEVSTAGRFLRKERIRGDLEGITIDPESGLLYVAREGADEILEIRADDLALVRRFKVDRMFGGDPNYLREGGDGLEGIAFRPATGGFPGRFFAVNQFDPPALLELDVPIAGKGEGRAKIVGAWAIPGPPLSGVTWVPEEETFLICSALWRAVYVTRPDGTRIRSVRIPGIMQEGITKLPDGSFAIVQDTGGLIRWFPEADPFAADNERVHVDDSGAVQTQKPNP